jgi:hypothetical protein
MRPNPSRQGWKFSVDYYILQLEGYGVVLGTQWLWMLGPIQWNFETLEMQFAWNGKPVVLQGIKHSEGQSKELLPICPTNTRSDMEAVDNSEKEGQERMERLLSEHEVFFVEPRELPPPCSHDHRIILQKGSGPVSVKPYWYPFHQKTEIEEQVKDMLERGIIRPSNSPYPHRCS